jgi:hypothetical protein
MLDQITHLIMQLPAIWIQRGQLAESVWASQRFGNPVVSSNIKYMVVIEQVATFGFTKMNFKFRFSSQYKWSY